MVYGIAQLLLLAFGVVAAVTVAGPFSTDEHLAAARVVGRVGRGPVRRRRAPVLLVAAPRVVLVAAARAVRRVRRADRRAGPAVAAAVGVRRRARAGAGLAGHREGPHRSARDRHDAARVLAPAPGCARVPRRLRAGDGCPCRRHRRHRHGPRALLDRPRRHRRHRPDPRRASGGSCRRPRRVLRRLPRPAPSPDSRRHRRARPQLRVGAPLRAVHAARRAHPERVVPVHRASARHEPLRRPPRPARRPPVARRAARRRDAHPASWRPLPLRPVDLPDHRAPSPFSRRPRSGCPQMRSWPGRVSVVDRTLVRTDRIRWRRDGARGGDGLRPSSDASHVAHAARPRQRRVGVRLRPVRGRRATCASRSELPFDSRCRGPRSWSWRACWRVWSWRTCRSVGCWGWWRGASS